MVVMFSGMEWCTSMSLPNATFKEDAPHFPFYGPVKASVSMIKKDVPNGYKFEAKVIMVGTSKMSHGQYKLILVI